MESLVRLMQTTLLLLGAVSVQQWFVVSAAKGNLELQSLTTSSSSLAAVYTSGKLQFDLTCGFQKDVPSAWRESGVVSYIVSTVSVTRLNGDERKSTVMSQLSFPEKYQFERKIPDMEKRIVHAAKSLLEAIQTSGLRLPELADLYEGMIDDLVQKVDLQGNFNQVHASATYHVSIIKTAQRLAKGISLESACPPHQAYNHAGLFVCQQEYNEHIYRMLPNLLAACNNEVCRQSFIGRLMEKMLSQLNGKQAAEMAEELYTTLGNNSKLAEEIARLIACGNISCVEPGCGMWLYGDGWHIYGADWGCCGDYAGCCYLATEVCLVHDAICTCCSFPVFCIDPFCKPDAWCSNVTSTASVP
ncbi:uncharacterized protein [Diadema setosum]|uniref:uncharacterized protein n=1 Tax=Diadema setosum TaxID=31175 RepID=UPI003B3B9700